MAEFAQRSCCVKAKIVWAAAVMSALSIFSLHLYRNPLASRKQAGNYAQVSKVEVIPITTGATGPESFAFDHDGKGPYTGVSDGRILKWEGDRWLEYAVDSPPSLSTACRGTQDPEREHLCGRPLGLQFHKKTRNLYIVDAYFGLLVVGPQDDFAKPVATGAEGHPFMFGNGLDIDQNNGIVYFTDSSMLFHRSDYDAMVKADDNTGRLMKYDLHTKEVQVLLRGLHFANGVQLSEDGSFVAVAETSRNRILRYWLRPPKAGSVEVLAHVPGGPDNVKRSPRGGFWVGVHGTQPARARLSVLLWLREVVIRSLFGVGRIFGRPNDEWVEKALAVRISEEGEILEEIEPFGSELGMSISEVEERNGTLWIGSVVKPYVGVCKL